MSTATRALVNELKDKGEDFEFYPTTPEIVGIVARNIAEGASLLDIGAGRGDVLKALEGKAGKLYAIEKSETLISQLPASVFVVGTDFHRQTLIDKKMDVIFCNPPFSEFERWAEKIIREANCTTVLLVMPERWKDSKPILEAIATREASTSPLGAFSFQDADRAARGTVELLRVNLGDRGSSPFNIWFDSEFKEEADKAKESDSLRSKERGLISKNKEILKGRNLIETLEELYLQELETLVASYRKIAEIPPSLLRELGVDSSKVIGGLELKIDGLKNQYWKELFDNLDKITDRLTTKSRRELLDTLTANTNVDFSASNAYAVILWAIKNANSYLDGQLVDLYKRISDEDGVKAYKSNRHFAEGNFRFHRSSIYDDEPTHYKLDYRLVNYCYAFRQWDLEYPNRDGSVTISDRARDIINDLCTVGKCLGFDVSEDAQSFMWQPGKLKEFSYLKDSETFDYEDFMSIRLYKNGNMHIKLNKKFLLRLNIEAARILKWVNSPQEAAAEMGESPRNVTEAWGSNAQLTLNPARLLT